MISAQYTCGLKSPPKYEWKGVGGTFATIAYLFPDISFYTINKVFKETFECEIRGEKYNARIKERLFKGTHLIARHFVYERMVCDLLERGRDVHHTMLLVNIKLKNDGMTEVGASCVQEIYQRLCPTIIPICKV